MTDPLLRRRAAQVAARTLIRRFGVSSASDIRLERIAKWYGARIAEAPLDGASGQLARNQNRSLILVPARSKHAYVRRVTIAHELGHLVLRHPSEPAHALCGGGFLRAMGCADAPDYEDEADTFADALLMPDELVRPRCEVSPVSLDIPRALAAEFKVPLPRAAARFAELTSERCAVVRSERGFVRKVVRSASFTRDIVTGRRLHPLSVAWDYFPR